MGNSFDPKWGFSLALDTNHEDALNLGNEDIVPLNDLPLGAIGDVKMVEMPNGYSIAFSTKYSKEDMNIVSQEYWRIVEQKATEQRLHFLLNSFLFWLAPCLVLYALGWSISWVYKGFKQKKGGQ